MNEISLVAEHLFSIGGFNVTNSILTTAVISVVIIVLAFVVHRKMTSSKKISKTQSGLELFIEGSFSVMDSVTNDDKLSRRFFALVMTLFIVILLSNWSGLIPGFGPIGIYEQKQVSEEVATTTEATQQDQSVVEPAEQEHAHEVFIPIFRGPSSDLNTTFALAIISLISFQVFGIAALGIFKYAGKFLNFKSPVGFFVGILEIISEIAKMISLSFRLFGNIFAGEVLLLVMAFLVPLIAPLPFFGLEIFVGLIQAFIFAMLTLVFLRIASMKPH